MAREFAKTRLTIWSDDDFTDLSPEAQHLYFVLKTSSLSYCGVGDWRPGRLAKRARGWTEEAVRAAAAELIERLYILVDESTEEVLVRSFIRHDEVLKQPTLAVSMANAHADIASPVLRRAVIHEIQRLKDEFPDLKGWGSPRATELLSRPSVDPSTYPLGKGSVQGSVRGEPTPEVRGFDQGSVTTVTSTATSTATPSQATADVQAEVLQLVQVEPKTARKPHGYSPAFEAFWLAYPKRNGKRDGKFEASLEFAKALKTVGADTLMAAVKAFAARREPLPPDAERWLKRRRWEDFSADPRPDLNEIRGPRFEGA